ncbi:hypothetical protein STAQ_13590 [Allostella sp. ATCC 35155]|nr:hypothetical protein STAQ_13590 [Stella sp. ATCC 35155]
MPLLLRHLMPLIVIGAFLVFSVICTLVMISLLGRSFSQRPREVARGPLIEGEARETDTAGESVSASETPGAR